MYYGRNPLGQQRGEQVIPHLHEDEMTQINAEVMDATFERTGEEGILKLLYADKNRKCHHKYIDASEKPYYFQIGVVSRKIFLHDEVAAESDGIPCHKHRDTDSQGFSPTPLQRVFTR